MNQKQKENEIFTIEEEIDEPFLSAAEIIREHYKNVMKATKTETRNERLIDLVNECRSFVGDLPEDWQKDFEEIDLLVSLSGGKRTNALVRKKLHYRLSVLRSKFTRMFYRQGKIVDRKEIKQNIVQAIDGGIEGFSPTKRESIFDDEEEKEEKQ